MPTVCRALVLLAAAAAGLRVPAAAQERVGSFTYVEHVDELTTERVYLGFTKAVDARGLDADGVLIVACAVGGEPLVSLRAGRILGDDQFVVVFDRFPGQPLKKTGWIPMAEGGGNTIKSAAPKAFLRRAGKSSYVVMRVFNYDGEAFTYKFMLDGLVAVVRRLPCFKP